MNSELTYQTILPETKRVEIGPLEEDAQPIEPAFLEWWKNQDFSDFSEVQFIALAAWKAHDSKITRLEADLEHFRCSSLPAQKEDLLKKSAQALGIAVEWCGLKQAKHKAWVIDQIVRALTGDKYDAFVARAKRGDEDADAYTWDCGVKP